MLRRSPQSRAALPQPTRQIHLQFLKVHDLCPDDAELLGDHVPNVDADFRRVALDRKQLADFVERESEPLRLLDKLEIGNFSLLIKSIPALRPRWSRQQARLFIEADSVDAQAGSLSDLTNLKRSGTHHPKDTAWTSLQSQTLGAYTSVGWVPRYIHVGGVGDARKLRKTWASEVGVNAPNQARLPAPHETSGTLRYAI
jgi:hypothetical protein